MTEQPRDASRKQPDPLLTTRQAAARLGVHERTVRRAIARGEIPALKEQGSYRLSAAAIDRIASLGEAPNPSRCLLRRLKRSLCRRP